MTVLIYAAMLQTAIDNQEKRDLAQEELHDYLEESKKVIEPETWELLPV